MSARPAHDVVQPARLPIQNRLYQADSVAHKRLSLFITASRLEAVQAFCREAKVDARAEEAELTEGEPGEGIEMSATHHAH